MLALVRVVNLLSQAFIEIPMVVIIPNFTVPTPMSKKGPRYKLGCILKIENYANDEDPTKESGHVVLEKNDCVVMAIEIKKSVGVDISQIDHNDVIEFLVHCHYAMRIFQTKEILATLTDGFVWHILSLKVTDREYRFDVNKYYCMASKNFSDVCTIIPKLLNL